MRWSDERILTTHTGSLPRPPELTRLYVRRARGEAIDRPELDRVGKAALRRSDRRGDGRRGRCRYWTSYDEPARADGHGRATRHRNGADHAARRI